MQYLPYILIVIGSIFIIISLCMPDREKKNAKKEPVLTQEDKAGLLAQGKKEIDEIFQDRAEDAIEKVDEQLSRISNEKIISVSEYSDQVLEKINQNHQEVVFLYNMLNEKEEEMKKMMTKMKVISKEDTAGEQQKERLAERAGTLAAGEKQAVQSINEWENVFQKEQDMQEDADLEMLRDLLYQREKAAVPSGSDTAVYEMEETKNISSMPAPGSFPENMPQAEENNFQAQVLAMYQRGMSVLDISRTLHRGQGEVRLIVELYAKNR